mgnify:CR=1 FL=1
MFSWDSYTRITPACAGKTIKRIQASVFAWDHPRVCGKNSNGDIIAMPYPFENNAKWPSGTKTIFKFQMQGNEGYTYKDQALAEMLQQGVLTVVMPRIE